MKIESKREKKVQKEISFKHSSQKEIHEGDGGAPASVPTTATRDHARRRRVRYRASSNRHLLLRPTPEEGDGGGGRRCYRRRGSPQHGEEDGMERVADRSGSRAIHPPSTSPPTPPPLLAVGEGVVAAAGGEGQLRHRRC